jgi:hypothetical protein
MEPGLFPTVYLRVLLSRRAAAPGEHISLRVDGTDAASLVRGKVLHIEQQREDGWQGVGVIIGARSSGVPSKWIPAGSPPFAVTLEGYRADSPLYFDAPPLDPGDYRIRLDATHPAGSIGDLRQRTATLYATLRLLPPG